MARSCKDGILLDAGGNQYRWYTTYDAVKGRWVGGSGYAVGMDGSLYIVLNRYDSGVKTQLARRGGIGVSGPMGIKCDATAILHMRGESESKLGVTDSVYSGPGDWVSGFGESLFECYDAPAPSGPKHRVIGSGIVNARRIVRGAA